MGDEEIERVRQYGKRWLTPKGGGGGGYFAMLQDEKINKELKYDRNNVCKKCHTVISRNGECLC